MRRRIRAAIVGVSGIILLALGVPLAIVVHRSALDAEVVELQATAARTLGEIDVPLDITQLRSLSTESDVPHRLGVYDASGRRLYGVGPGRPDREVRLALRGRTASSSDDEIVVATPIVEPGSERVRGVLRTSEPLTGADERSRNAWAVMAVAGVAALGLAWVMANRLARLLSEPLTDLATKARSIGELGEPDDRVPSGIEEIDELASVLADRAHAVRRAILHERQFSADVSHQLRTPVTALRLKLERADEEAHSEVLASGLADLDRLEVTISHLLAVARDTVGSGDEIRLDEVVADAVERWQPAALAAGRAVRLGDVGPTTVLGGRASVDEVLNVLIDNALRHGRGVVTISLRHLVGGIAIDVTDEGDAIRPLDAERIFERGYHTGEGQGIGLDVARSLAEAEGGRLVLSAHRPTTFSFVLVLPVAPVQVSG